MLGQVEARVQELLSEVIPKLTRIWKTGVTQSEAETICQAIGTRLPTVRELAQISQSLGAKGISETMEKQYYLVKGSDSAGKPDHFYFSSKGFQTRHSKLGNYFYWSSSAHPDDPTKVYGLKGNSGALFEIDRSYDHDETAVRCVQ